jgi:hypothetical protein
VLPSSTCYTCNNFPNFTDAQALATAFSTLILGTKVPQSFSLFNGREIHIRHRICGEKQISPPACITHHAVCPTCLVLIMKIQLCSRCLHFICIYLYYLYTCVFTVLCTQHHFTHLEGVPVFRQNPDIFMVQECSMAS